MSSRITETLTMKMFVGILATSEVRMHLTQSMLWKQITIVREEKGAELQQVHYQGKDYVGFYLEEQAADLIQIQKYEEAVKEKVQKYCPDLDCRKQPVVIFGQVFCA